MLLMNTDEMGALQKEWQKQELQNSSSKRETIVKWNGCVEWYKTLA